MKTVFIIFASILLYSSISASDFKYQASLDNIIATGYYKVVLTPDIITRIKDNFADLRLYDSNNKEIPYILSMESALVENSLFREHKILSNKNDKKQEVNKIVIQNNSINAIDYLYLVYRNSDIDKEITLKGSDDLLNWYIIAQAYPENIGLTDNSTAQIKYLKFSRSSYKYFMIQTSIKYQEPLQLLRVGYYENGKIPGQYVKLPSPKLKQGDSLKYKLSFVKVNFPASYKLSRLRIFVSSPEIYYRKFKVYSIRNTTRELISEDILSSKKSNVFDFHKFRTREILLIIENEDNPPLKIDSVSAYQLGAYITTKLYSGVKYYLRFDNKEMPAPNYDLEYFKDRIPENLERITPSTPIKIDVQNQVVKPKPLFNKTILWVILVVVIITIAVVTIKVSREV